MSMVGQFFGASALGEIKVTVQRNQPKRERRLRPRKRVSIDVYVYSPGHSVRRCKTHNLSSNGVFVDVEKLGVGPGSTVELVFVIRRGPIIRVHRLWAIVARLTGNGVGMMLNRKVRPQPHPMQPARF